jgi:hypothetical protein
MMKAYHVGACLVGMSRIVVGDGPSTIRNVLNGTLMEMKTKAF